MFDIQGALQVAQAIGANLSGGGNSSWRKQLLKQYEYQREILSNQIQWRMADAQAAGVHPLAALGINPASGGFGAVAADPFEDMGQDLSRAVAAMYDRRERVAQAAIQKADQARADAIAAAEIDRTRAEADLARARAFDIRTPQRDQLPPPRPNAGSHGGTLAAPDLAPVPSQPVIGSASNPARDAGAINAYAYQRLDPDTLSIVQSYDAKQRTEDDLLASAEWFLQNRVSHWYSGLPPPSPQEYPPGPGRHWVWDPDSQVFRAVPRSVNRIHPNGVLRQPRPWQRRATTGPAKDRSNRGYRF